MGLQTKPNCDAFLVFEPSEATKIANIMTEVSERSENKELQMSAVKELGSNMICAFFAAVADFSELSLVPSPPSVSTNIFKTIFYDFLAQPTNPDNLALIFQIQLKQKTGSANGYFILIPTADFQRQLIDAGKKSFDINNLEKLD
jgi:chemotaxis protein CheC